MTKTDLANLALSKIGESLIDDIADTDDKASRLAALHYEPTLKEVLRAHFWGFAMGVVEIDRTVAETVASTYASATILFDDDYVVDGDSVTIGDAVFVFRKTPSQPYDVAIGDGAATTIAENLYEAVNLRIYHTIARALAIGPEVDITAAVAGVAGNSIGISGLFSNPAAATFSGATLTGGTDGNSGPPGSLLTVGISGFAAAFLLPADFIKLRRVLTVDGARVDSFDFRRIDGNRYLVASDYDSIRLDYVQFVDDPDAYDPLFLAAFTTLLASRLARSISGSEALEGQLRQIYETVDLPAARCADGHDSQSNENHPLQEILAGALTGQRANFFSDND